MNKLFLYRISYMSLIIYLFYLFYSQKTETFNNNNNKQCFYQFKKILYINLKNRKRSQKTNS